jgi:hypothetical protein
VPSSVHTFLTTPIPTRGVINYTWCAPMCYPHIHGVPGLIRSAQRQITAINLRHRVDYRLTPAYNIRANRLNSGLTSSPFHTTAHLERPACLLPLWPASISPIVTTCHTNRVEECCPLQLLCAVDREVCLRLSTHSSHHPRTLPSHKDPLNSAFLSRAVLRRQQLLTHAYSDAKVANRDTKVWHFVIENGY